MNRSRPKPAPDPSRAAFIVCVVVAAITILDVSKINVGIPAIEQQLGAGPTEIQGIVAGYALAFGLTLVPAGRLGDIRSRRRMFIVGLIAFTLASLWCALAPDIGMLVIGRLLQGLAGGILMPQTLGIIQQLFQGPARGRAFGVFGASIGIATAIGPTLGGLLVTVGGSDWGWRLLFAMNVPLGVIALVFAARTLPSMPPRPDISDRSLDLIGTALLGITVFSLMLPFALTTGTDADDPRRWVWLAVAALGGALFLWWERRYLALGRSPLVHLGLFRVVSFRRGTIIAASHFATMPALFLILTLLVQQGLGYPAVIAGLISMPFALATSVAAWVGGRLLERFGARLVATGVVLMFSGFALVVAAAVLVPVELVPLAIALLVTVPGIGSGLVVSPNQALTLSEVPVEHGGVAGSVGQVGQRVGTAIGIAVTVSVYYSTLNMMGGTAGADAAAFRFAFFVGASVALSLFLVAAVVAWLEVRRPRAR